MLRSVWPFVHRLHNLERTTTAGWFMSYQSTGILLCRIFDANLHTSRRVDDIAFTAKQSVIVSLIILCAEYLSSKLLLLLFSFYYLSTYRSNPCYCPQPSMLLQYPITDAQ